MLLHRNSTAPSRNALRRRSLTPLAPPQIDRDATGHAGGAVRAEQAPPTECIPQRGKFRLSLSHCTQTLLTPSAAVSYASLCPLDSPLTRGKVLPFPCVDSTLAVSPKGTNPKIFFPLDSPPPTIEPASSKFNPCRTHFSTSGGAFDALLAARTINSGLKRHPRRK